MIEPNSKEEAGGGDVQLSGMEMLDSPKPPPLSHEERSQSSLKPPTKPQRSVSPVPPSGGIVSPKPAPVSPMPGKVSSKPAPAFIRGGKKPLSRTRSLPRLQSNTNSNSKSSLSPKRGAGASSKAMNNRGSKAKQQQMQQQMQQQQRQRTNRRSSMGNTNTGRRPSMGASAGMGRRPSMGAALPRVSRRVSIGNEAVGVTQTTWGQKPMRRSSLTGGNYHYAHNSPMQSPAAAGMMANNNNNNNSGYIIHTNQPTPIMEDISNSQQDMSNSQNNNDSMSQLSRRSSVSSQGSQGSNYSDYTADDDDDDDEDDRRRLSASNNNNNNKGGIQLGGKSGKNQDVPATVPTRIRADSLDDQSVVSEYSYANDSVHLLKKKKKQKSGDNKSTKGRLNDFLDRHGDEDDADSCDADTYANDSLDLRKYNNKKKLHKAEPDVEDDDSCDADTYANDSLDLRNYNKKKLTRQEARGDYDNEAAVEDDDSCDADTYANDSLDLRNYNKKKLSRQEARGDYDNEAAVEDDDSCDTDTYANDSLDLRNYNKKKLTRQEARGDYDNDDLDDDSGADSCDDDTYANDSLDLRQYNKKKLTKAPSGVGSEGLDDSMTSSAYSYAVDSVDFRTFRRNKALQRKVSAEELGYGKVQPPLPAVVAPPTRADLGYDDEPPPVPTAVDLGYGNAIPVPAAVDLGYGDAAPLPAAVDLGYGDAAPSGQDLGYGNVDSPPTQAELEYGDDDVQQPWDQDYEDASYDAYSYAADSLDLRIKQQPTTTTRTATTTEDEYDSAEDDDETETGDDTDSNKTPIDYMTRIVMGYQKKGAAGPSRRMSNESTASSIYSYACDSVVMKAKNDMGYQQKGDGEEKDDDDETETGDDTDSNKTPIDYMTRIVMGYQKKGAAGPSRRMSNESTASSIYSYACDSVVMKAKNVMGYQQKGNGEEEDDDDETEMGDDADSTKTPIDYMTRIVMGYQKKGAAGPSRRMSNESTASSIYSYACDSVVMKPNKQQKLKKDNPTLLSGGGTGTKANREGYDDDYSDEDYSSDESHHGAGRNNNPYLSAMLGYGDAGRSHLQASADVDTGAERRLSCNSYSNDSVDMRKLRLSDEYAEAEGEGKKRRSVRRVSMDESVDSAISARGLDPEYLNDVLGYALQPGTIAAGPSGSKNNNNSLAAAPRQRDSAAYPQQLLVTTGGAGLDLMDSVTSFGSAPDDWDLSPMGPSAPKLSVSASKAMTIQASMGGLMDNDMSNNSEDCEYENMGMPTVRNSGSTG